MKIKLILFFLIYATFLNGQIEFGTGRYMGKDKDLFQAKSYVQLSAFIPSLVFKIYSKKSNYKVSGKLTPSFKFLWYNFDNNLVVNTQNQKTIIQIDSVASNIYKNGLFKKTSQLNITSLFIPITIPI